MFFNLLTNEIRFLKKLHFTHLMLIARTLQSSAMYRLWVYYADSFYASPCPYTPMATSPKLNSIPIWDTLMMM